MSYHHISDCVYIPPGFSLSACTVATTALELFHLLGLAQITRYAYTLELVNLPPRGLVLKLCTAYLLLRSTYCLWSEGNCHTRYLDFPGDSLSLSSRETGIECSRQNRTSMPPWLLSRPLIHELYSAPIFLRSCTSTEFKSLYGVHIHV